MTTTLVDVGAAQITRDGTGAVTIDDPDSPILIRVRTDTSSGPARIVELVVIARHPSARITSASLAHLPLAQIRHVAVTAGHPNDALWQTQASPKPVGARSWGLAHWHEVLDVDEWAVSTGRPGGGPQAVADMWHVARNPTAYRWIKRALVETGRRRAGKNHALPPR